jgi:hypothetical protein
MAIYLIVKITAKKDVRITEFPGFILFRLHVISIIKCFSGENYENMPNKKSYKTGIYPAK